MTPGPHPAPSPDFFAQLAATDPFHRRARRLFERGQVLTVNGNQADLQVGFDANNNPLVLKEVPIVSGYVPQVGDWVAIQYEGGDSGAPWVIGPSMAADASQDSPGIGVFAVSPDAPTDPQMSTVYFDESRAAWRGWDGSDWVDFGAKLHNLLPDLQGGTAGQYYHLTQAEHDALQAAVGPPAAGYMLHATAPSAVAWTQHPRLADAGSFGFATNGSITRAGANLLSVNSQLCFAGDTTAYFSSAAAGRIALAGDLRLSGGGVALASTPLANWLTVASGRGVSSEGNLALVAAAASHIFLDAGGEYRFRDRDDSNAVRVTIDTATGDITASIGDINAQAGKLQEGGSDLIPSDTTTGCMIMMWSGSVANIPAGWVLCDGAGNTPDLRSRFILAAGGTYNPGSTGGSLSHTHGDGTYAAASHYHGSSGLSVTSHTTGSFQGGPGPALVGPVTHAVSGNTAPAGPHTVSGTSGSAGTFPSYYALCFIAKD